MIEFLLQNQLALNPLQILNTDDANVQAEVEMVVDGGTVHPPPPQPVRFSPTAQRKEECSEGRNDTEADLAQDNS